MHLNATHNRLLSVLSWLLPFFSNDTHATNYYLSAEGRDDAPGTSARTPWQTLARLQRVTLRPGDRVYLRGGDTFAGSLSIENVRATTRRPLTISSYGNGRAIISAGKGDGLFLRNCSGVVVKNIEFAGAGYPANKGTGLRILNTLPGAVRLSFVRIRNCVAHGFGKEGFYVGSSNFGPLPLPDGSAQAPPDNSQSGFSNVRIDDCTAYDNVYYGIYVTGVWDDKATAYANHNVRIRRCTAYNNPGDPEFMDNHSGSGILLDNVQDGQIDRCVAYNNGYRCDAHVGGPCGIWAHAADRVVISRCISVNNRTGKGVDGAGFDFDAGVSNSVMRHNISGFNDGAGYLLYVYAPAPHRFVNNRAHHNISVNDGRKNDYAGFHIRNDGTGITNLRIDNNRVYQTPSPNRKSSGIYLWNTVDATLTRNVLVGAGDVPLLRIRPNHKQLLIRENTYWSTSDSLRIDGNIYHDNKPASKAIPKFADVRAWSEASGHERKNGRFTGRVRQPDLRWVAQVERLAERYH